MTHFNQDALASGSLAHRSLCRPIPTVTRIDANGCALPPKLLGVSCNWALVDCADCLTVIFRDAHARASKVSPKVYKRIAK